MDDALEFADVSRPGMRAEARQGQWGETADGLAVNGGEALREEIRQHREVVPAVPQRGDGEANSGKAMAKINPEGWGSSEFTEGLVGAEEYLAGNGVRRPACLLMIEP